MIKMGLEVTRILARANGSFQSRKMKNSTLGMSSRRSQYRTLENGHSRWLSGGDHSTPASHTHKNREGCACPPHTRARTHTRPLLEPLWRAGVELSVLTEEEKLKIFADCFKVVLIAPF